MKICGAAKWYARSAEFLHHPLLQNLVWSRAAGDTIFAAAWSVLPCS
jgi:nitric oxide reductase large subunit